MSYSETITKEDLKNVLNEVLPLPANTRLQFVGDYGSTIFNGTWTATDNGIMIQMLGANTSGSNAYWYINDTTENKPVGCISFTANGTTNSASFPIVKGHTYASSAVNAVNSATAYFFKFVTGIFSQADEVDYIVEQGTSGIWTYRKWNSGISECWGVYTASSKTYTAHNGQAFNQALPSELFNTTSTMVVNATGRIDGVGASGVGFTTINSTTQLQIWLENFTAASQSNKTGVMYIHVKGTWK